MALGIRGAIYSASAEELVQLVNNVFHQCAGGLYEQCRQNEACVLGRVLL